MNLRKIVASSALAIAASVGSVNAITPTNIFVFGDSLSDAGYQNTIPTWSDVLALAGVGSAWSTGYWLNDQACIDATAFGLGNICNVFPYASPTEQKQPTWTTFYYSGIEGGNLTGVQTNYTWSQLLLAQYNIVTLQNSAMNQASVNSTKITGTTSYDGVTVNPNNFEESISVTRDLPGLGPVPLNISIDITTENIGVMSMPNAVITAVDVPVPLSLTDLPNAQPQDGEPTGGVFAAGGSTTSGEGLGSCQNLSAGTACVADSSSNYLLYYPPSTEVQVQAYLDGVDDGTYQSPNAKVNSVYIIWAGANNIFKAQLAGTPDADMPAVADAAVTDIMTQAESLISAGAQHILILNLPNLGDTPITVSQGITAQAAAEALSAYFNTSLTNQVANSGYADIIKIVDIYTELNYMVETSHTSSNIQINGSPLYFSNTYLPACGYGDDNLEATTYAEIGSIQALTCTPRLGTVSAVDYFSSPQDFSNWIDSTNTANYLFTDGVHPSAEGHKAVQILVQNSIENNWNGGDGSNGWNSFWDFLLQIISLGMAK